MDRIWEQIFALHDGITALIFREENNIHSIWFIRNTSKIPICLFPKFSINSLMIVAYLFLKLLIILNKLFLTDKQFTGHLSTKFHDKRIFMKLKLVI